MGRCEGVEVGRAVGLGEGPTEGAALGNAVHRRKVYTTLDMLSFPLFYLIFPIYYSFYIVYIIVIVIIVIIININIIIVIITIYYYLVMRYLQ